MQHVSHRHSDEIAQLNQRIEYLEAENAKLREALKPFASPKFTTDSADGKDDLTLRSKDGQLCIPDGHGYWLAWSDEDAGDPVKVTAGQIRRARAAFANSEGK